MDLDEYNLICVLDIVNRYYNWKTTESKELQSLGGKDIIGCHGFGIFIFCKIVCV
jgi:hypothetical protein